MPSIVLTDGEKVHAEWVELGGEWVTAELNGTERVRYPKERVKRVSSDPRDDRVEEISLGEWSVSHRGS